jgi:hypothetical protein
MIMMEGNMMMNKEISGRIGYWVIILCCVVAAVCLEVRNRELEYNEIYLRGSNLSLMQQNMTLRIICQQLFDSKP